jgi:2-C-methyl-D-erythritol 4-phosphate cytidylyltransferase
MSQYATPNNLSSKKYAVIIVGGGTGSRMGSAIPKQFMLLRQKPVLMHTIEAFYNSDLKPQIIVVLNIDFHLYWEEVCKRYHFNIPHQLVKGGNQRFYSVKNGLKALKGPTVVAIHDAVRPLVSNKIITDSFLQAESNNSAVTAIRSTDSIRQTSGNTTIALNRDDIYLIQTPQAFKTDILKNAYNQPYRNEFTDDASVVEKCGVPIKLIPGEKKNIKITLPEDLLLAEYYLAETQ